MKVIAQGAAVLAVYIGALLAIMAIAVLGALAILAIDQALGLLS